MSFLERYDEDFFSDLCWCCKIIEIYLRSQTCQIKTPMCDLLVRCSKLAHDSGVNEVLAHLLTAFLPDRVLLLPDMISHLSLSQNLRHQG